VPIASTIHHFLFNLYNTDSCIRYYLKLCLSVSNEIRFISIQELNDEGQVINFEAIIDWARRDILARNYICVSICCYRCHDRTSGTENAHKLSICSRYVESSLCTTPSGCSIKSARVAAQILKNQYQPGHDIMSHITEIETMASRLSDVGAAMSDIQIMTKIICSLPSPAHYAGQEINKMQQTQRSLPRTILQMQIHRD
jgi:hypothetical protein